MGDVRFTIVLGSRIHTGDGRQLPAAFSVYYWELDEDAEPRRLTKVESYRDGYVDVDGIYLPASRRITTGDDTGSTTALLRLSGHRLLLRRDGADSMSTRRMLVRTVGVVLLLAGCSAGDTGAADRSADQTGEQAGKHSEPREKDEADQGSTIPDRPR